MVLAVLLAVAGTLAFGRGSSAATIAGLVLLVWVPGAGLALLVPLPRDYRRLPFILLFALTWSTFVGLLTAYARITDGYWIFALSAAPALVGASVRIGRALTGRPDASDRPSGVPRPDAVTVTSGSLVAAVACGVGLLAAAVLTVVASGRVSDAAVGVWGLLPALGPLYLVAIVLVVGVLVFAGLARTASGPVSVAGLVTLGFVVASPPAIIATRLLAGWNYKHIGAVELIANGRGLTHPEDLFQSWPGFFAVAANLVNLAGTDPVEYANWATPVFLGLAAVAVYAAARQIVREVRFAAVIATALFLCTVWSNQIYYSPQSFAFVIAMLLWAVALPLLQDRSASHHDLGGRSWSRALRRGMIRTALTGRDELVTTSAVAAAFVAIVTSHQLTPYFILLGVIALAFLLRMSRATRWLIAFMLAVAVIYPLIHHDALREYSIFTAFSFGSLNPAGSGTGIPSQQMVVAMIAARSVAVVTVIAALVATVARRKRLGSILIPLVLAITPAALVLVQNYGGEAIYRIWLFSSPWAAIIIAAGIVGMRRAAARKVTTAVWGLLLPLLLLASAQATNFGMYHLARVPDDDLSVAQWFYRNTEPGTRLVMAGASFPGRLTEDYVAHSDLGAVNDLAMFDDARFSGAGLDETTPAALAAYVTTNSGGSSYLAVGEGMRNEAAYFGDVAPGALDRLVQRLTASTEWEVSYSSGDSYLFTLTGVTP
ncbi:hypothetical protein BJQ94_12330 [Cryobacterium sp. SO2]|uniref:hypothetical protein n=1 Tax=Cryobacterium sp. SO2 TaxID=1897060 RepID=UPI00223E5D83|nr:hypothetical protein [Cryobacterium sp. SO2]WEO76158.1 hypothetical protein BJQ94_12330 [Cryobacterium sp. SO2]